MWNSKNNTLSKTQLYTMKMTPYVENWEDILLHLSKLLFLQSSTLMECFWPLKNSSSNYVKASLLSTMEVVDVEDLVMCPYYGPRNLKIVLAYTPFKNLDNGDFVIVRPHDLILVPMWMGRTQSDVVKDDQNENFKMVMVFGGFQ